MIKFTHLRCPLHRYTFSVAPIRKWVEARCEGTVLNLFAGYTLLNLPPGCFEIRNDCDPEAPAQYHMDALEFCRTCTTERFGTLLLDPPYSYRKSMEMYGGRKMSAFRQLKDEIPRILTPGGLVITFGYHSISMGNSRGFSLEEVVILSHGGAIHDTLVSVERFRG